MKQYATAALLVLVVSVGLIQAKPVQLRSAAEVKIGVVDIEDVISTSPAGVRANQAFEATRKAKQDELNSQQEVLKRESSELEKQKPTLDAEAFEKRRQQLEQNFVELQQTYVKLERELAQHRTSLVADLMKLAEPELQKMAKNEGLSLILDKNSTVWFDSKLDLTARIKSELK